MLVKCVHGSCRSERENLWKTLSCSSRRWAHCSFSSFASCFLRLNKKKKKKQKKKKKNININNTKFNYINDSMS